MTHFQLRLLALAASTLVALAACAAGNSTDCTTDSDCLSRFGYRPNSYVDDSLTATPYDEPQSAESSAWLRNSGQGRIS